MTDPTTQPKITELRVEVLHADGSRTFVTYIPEHNDTLRIELAADAVPEAEQQIVMTADAAITPLVRDGQQPSRYRITVSGVALQHVETLVRARPTGR